MECIKKDFLNRAIENGWTVTKLSEKQYQFECDLSKRYHKSTKLFESKRSISVPVTKNDYRFIKI